MAQAAHHDGYEYRTDVSFRLRHQTGSEGKKYGERVTGVRPFGTVVAREPSLQHVHVIKPNGNAPGGVASLSSRDNGRRQMRSVVCSSHGAP